MIVNKDRIIYNTLILASILAIIMGSIKYSDSELFNCNNFIITGCNLSNKISIENQFEYVKNKTIFDINKDEIRTKLINNDFISSADIAIVLPNTLIISISEIKPISIIKIDKNSFLVDGNSNGFPYNDNPSKLIGIPRIFLNNISSLENAFEEFEYKFIKNIHSNYYSLYKKINQIRFSDTKLIVSFNISGNNNSVYFDFKDYRNQTKYLHAFLKTLDNLDEKYYYEYIKFAGETIIVKEERNI